ncbi:MAG TPA: DUF4350 domain-containing protein [Streptosporangiaceae bacterium]
MSRPAGAAPASTAPTGTASAGTAPARTGPDGTRLSQPVSAGPVESWRQWRAPLGIVLVILLGGALIALLQPSASTPRYLDPRDAGQSGARALAALLAQRGEPVIRAGTVESAEKAARGRVTLVITSPGLLSARQLRSLAGVRSSLLLVEPVSASLAALAPGATVAGHGPVRTASPGCGLSAARLAGNADMGDVLLRSTAPGAWQCYPVDGDPSLVRYSTGSRTTGSRTTSGQTTSGQSAGGRTITLLGSGAPLTNQYLARHGNAALALDLLSGSSRIVWLVPPLPLAGAPPGGPPAGGTQSFFTLIPWPAYLVTIQLVIAVALAALWRMRRLGPLVAEPLPVIVRASETVEGHGRLYRSRRSRDRAAAVLRAAALDRITTRLALPRGAGADAVCAAVAARTGREAGTIRAIMFGAVPRDDAALVALAHEIDTLEADTLEAGSLKAGTLQADTLEGQVRTY